VLCRYITRRTISEKRLWISPQGRVYYELKSPWKSGITHIDWDAVDFIAKLAALVPPPYAHSWHPRGRASTLRAEPHRWTSAPTSARGHER
jgi:hypothetical protein